MPFVSLDLGHMRFSFGWEYGRTDIGENPLTDQMEIAA